MPRAVMAAVLLATCIVPNTAHAATIQLSLNMVAGRDIDIPVTGPPYIEFKAQRSSWGTVTFGGSLVAYYVLSSADLRHEATGALTYPGNLITIVIRTASAPSEILILRGSARPLSEGGGVYGGVIVATGAVGFLRGASFTTAPGGSGVTVLTINY